MILSEKENLCFHSRVCHWPCALHALPLWCCGVYFCCFILECFYLKRMLNFSEALCASVDTVKQFLSCMSLVCYRVTAGYFLFWVVTLRMSGMAAALSWCLSLHCAIRLCGVFLEGFASMVISFVSFSVRLCLSLTLVSASRWPYRKGFRNIPPLSVKEEFREKGC